MKILLTLFLTISLLLVFKQSTLAEDNISLDPQRINPDSVMFNVKRLYEKVRIKLHFSNKGKAKYHFHLLENRISELTYLADNEIIDPIEDATYRVSYEAGRAAELLEDSDDDELKERLAKQYDLYANYLVSIRDNYELHSGYWRLVQQNIDSLHTLGDQLM